MVGAVSASGIALRTFRFAPSPHAPRLSGVVNPFHGRRGVRKRYCPSDLPLRSIPPRAAPEWRGKSFSWSKWWSQAVLSFGPSASLHPPTPDGAVSPAYGRGWPGSSGQHRLRPCHPLLPFIAKVARSSPAYGRGWPGSSGQHRLRPGTYPLLPTPAGAVHTQTFNQHHPPLRLP